eukprot:gene46514-58000_t
MSLLTLGTTPYAGSTGLKTNVLRVVYNCAEYVDCENCHVASYTDAEVVYACANITDVCRSSTSSRRRLTTVEEEADDDIITFDTTLTLHAVTESPLSAASQLSIRQAVASSMTTVSFESRKLVIGSFEIQAMIVSNYSEDPDTIYALLTTRLNDALFSCALKNATKINFVTNGATGTNFDEQCMLSASHLAVMWVVWESWSGCKWASRANTR